ncbi:MAG TPA: single-stranded DNA-binding protein [Dongiaceae bacterium]|nr:single-stranded DNA-binding protein [Dongiaceae bacterium]
MININNITLQGRLVREPTLRSGNGSSMAFFTLASNYRYHDQGNAVHEEVAFVPCKVFGKWTEEMAGRKKGEMALVAGRLRTETWGQGEAQESKLILICDSVQIVVPAGRNESRSQTSGVVASGNGEPPADDRASDPKMPPF